MADIKPEPSLENDLKQARARYDADVKLARFRWKFRGATLEEQAKMIMKEPVRCEKHFYWLKPDVRIKIMQIILAKAHVIKVHVQESSGLYFTKSGPKLSDAFYAVIVYPFPGVKGAPYMRIVDNLKKRPTEEETFEIVQAYFPKVRQIMGWTK